MHTPEGNDNIELIETTGRGTRFSDLAEASVRHDITFAKTEEVERVVCTDVVEADCDDAHIDLTKRMLRLLSDIDGLGLAAPQIGIKKNFFVFWDHLNNPRVRYNPKYYPDGHSATAWHEKCLTYGNQPYRIKRYKTIRAVWFEYDFETKKLVKVTKQLKGRDCQVFQHETDHLNGHTIATKGSIVSAIED